MKGPAELRVAGVARRGTFELDVEFVAVPGELTVIVGPNAAGKSTLFGVIAGLVALETGTVQFGDRTWDAPEQLIWVPPQERNVGVVFQDQRLVPHLRVVDNVAFGRRARGESKAVARTAALAILERVGIVGLREQRPSSLSGGESQRVAIARAIATDPDVLLLDEPLAATDVTTRTSMRALLRDVAREFEGPCVFVTHDPFEALAMADRIVVLEHGRVTQSGTVAEIRRRPRSRYVADLLGSNVLHGELRGSEIVTTVGVALAVIPRDLHGSVCAVIEPHAVALHVARPDTSARNVWEMRVTMIDDDGSGRVRVQLGGPFELAAEITSAAMKSLGLAPGAQTWASVKATEIRVEAI